jgi:hypothetical protein
VIGVYADLFTKKTLHPRTQNRFDANGKPLSNGKFDGVVVAAMPWTWKNGNPELKAPKAIGWTDKYQDPIIYGTQVSDVMFFDRFADDHNGSWLVGLNGDDWLITDQTDNKGVDRLTGGLGADQFIFGFQRYGQYKIPYLGDAYAVVTDFNPAEDFLKFGSLSNEVQARSDPGMSATEGAGIGFYHNNDLIAYVKNLSSGQIPSLISSGRITFGQYANLDAALFA